MAASWTACLPELEEKGYDAVVCSSNEDVIKEYRSKVILESGLYLGLSANYWNETVSNNKGGKNNPAISYSTSRPWEST